MIKYLAAVGLKKYIPKDKLKELINDVIEAPTKKFISNYNEETIKLEYVKKYSDNSGIIIRGQMSDKEEIVVESVIPYFDANNNIDIIEAEVVNIDDGLLYYVMCEDENTGTQMDFCLQNISDYLDVKDKEDIYINGASIVGLCIDGKVILNVDKDDVEQSMDNEEAQWHKELLKRARQGDEEAQDLLDIEEEEMEDIIEERLKDEDIFTIFEGFFMPYGDNEGMYYILGTIEKYETIENKKSGEVFYNLYLYSMGLNFQVCVNKEDLVGEPIEGMRFVGACWVQGKLSFEE